MAFTSISPFTSTCILMLAAVEAKNTARKKLGKYSVSQLLDKAEEYIDQFEFQLAQKFCQRALELEVG